jgi:hypothetical protein
MSANFCDNSGLMFGLDFHDFYMLGPTPILGLLGVPPWPNYPHIVAAPFWWVSATSEKRTATVKSDNWKMVQQGFTLELVQHVPMADLANYGALEYPYLAYVVAESSSEATMAAHTVTGEGKPLATCLGPPWESTRTAPRFPCRRTPSSTSTR